MPASPITQSAGVVSVNVSSGGSKIPDTAQLVELTVHRAVNSVPWARLVLLDGDMTDGSFDLGDTALFAPDAEVEISLGYDDSETLVFKGVVVKMGLRISGENDSRLEIECRDEAARMTMGRNSTSFENKNDSEVIRSLVVAHGLTCDVSATRPTRVGLVQHRCSDWEFMLTRADANGLLVTVTDGKVSVKPPDTSAAAALRVTWGADLMEFEGDIDARTPFTAVAATSRDPGAQAMRMEAGTAPLSTQDRKDWADAQRLKAELARVRGRIKFQGSALAAPATTLELAGLGARFNGKVFVSSVRHEVAEGNWITEVEFGLAPGWCAERPDGVAPALGGLRPGVRGLQIGVVTRLDADPDNERRVQVSMKNLGGAAQVVWARLALLHASSGFGVFFVPEIDDEVVLGYLDDDPSSPVVLGSLYSSKRAAAYEMEAGNNTKAIVTRCKSRIEFDEDRHSITITTPGDNKLVFSDDKQCVVVTDQNGNRVELDTSGITLDSPKDIKITAKGSISLDAVGKISVTSKADVASEGLNVTCTAQVGFAAKGEATAELSATGQTTVKGAMVMIN